MKIIKKNWLAAREYLFYQEHKESVDKYGKPTPAMMMSHEEFSQLFSILEKQNIERTNYIENWKINNYSNRNVLNPNQEETKNNEENNYEQ